MVDSIPDQPAPDLAAAFSKPSGADPNPPPTEIERLAVLDLRAYAGDVNQGRARRVLPYWQRFEELSADEMLAVIETFPPGEDPDRTMRRAIVDAPDQPADTGTHWTARPEPGGGYISGAPTWLGSELDDLREGRS